MRRALALGVAIAAAAAGCGKKGGKARPGDGGAGVVLIDPRQVARDRVAELEPNDDQAHAQALAPRSGGEFGAAGTLAGPKDSDWYAFEVAAGVERRVVAVTLPPSPGVDLGFELHGPGGLVASVDDARPGDGEAVANFGLAPGRYLVRVRAIPPKKKKAGEPDAGPPKNPAYALILRISDPAAGEELEPNDAPAFAAELRPGDAISGYLAPRKDVDVYKVPLDAVQAAGALRVEVAAPAGVAPMLTLLDATEARLLERTGKAGSPLIARGLTPRPGDPYAFVAVSSSAGRSLSADPGQKYTLQVDIDSVAAGAEREPNDTPESAVALSEDGVAAADRDGRASGTLAAGDVDVYRLRVAAGQLVRFELQPGAGADDAKADLALAVLESGKVVRALDETALKGSELLPAWWVAAEDDVVVTVRAKLKGVAEVGYQLAWAAHADDGRSEREPNDDAAHATLLVEDAPLSATFGWKGDVDVFRIAALSSSALSFDIGKVAGVTWGVQLLDDKRKVIAEVAGSPGAQVTLRATVDPSRTYLLRVSDSKAKTGRPQAPYEVVLHAE